ncbi:MAG: ATP-binding protein [Myxococcota bacterium]
MEFAALNRVLCNLVDNASRFAADQSVTLYVVPVNTHGAYTNLRFAVVNKLDSFQKKILQEHYGNNLHFLFAGGFTTDGSGLGMSICADFVTDSYGLSCNEEAADHGYFGARLLGDYFAVWFHWPGRQLTERNQPSSDAA